MPGADLVGFGRDTNGDCFAFGEVKTSQEDKYPPRVIYGRTGLKKQLENLRDSEEIRSDLVLYLSHRAKHATWHTQFKSATKRYINNTSDVQIYGILIRDVQPGQNDLHKMVIELNAGRPETMRIELLALYLPQNCLESGENLFSASKSGQ